MKRQSILVIILLSLFIIIGCSGSKEPATIELPRIKATFDGETCLLTGNEAVTLNGAILEFENQSDSDANLITLLLKENKSPDEIFQSFQPGSTEYPEGSFKHGKSPSVASGGGFNDFTTKFYEGNYAILCERSATQELYFGGWFTYE